MQDNIRLSKAAVQRLGLEMIVVKAGNESEIESAVVAAVQQQANALSIGNDAYLSSRSRQVAFFALRHALPTMSESRDGVAAGLLMSYGPNQAETFRQAGLYVGRILKGENRLTCRSCSRRTSSYSSISRRQGARPHSSASCLPAPTR